MTETKEDFYITPTIPVLSESAKDRFYWGTAALLEFIGGKPPAVSVGNSKFVVNTTEDRIQIIQMAGCPLPVISGKWMGFWDADLAPYMTKPEYNEAPRTQKMLADAKVQLTKYAEDQFFMLFAELWMAEEYDQWRATTPLNMRSVWRETNKYWKPIVISRIQEMCASP